MVGGARLAVRARGRERRRRRLRGRGRGLCDAMMMPMTKQRPAARRRNASLTHARNTRNNSTKCLRPCYYKEYRMVNGPTPSSVRFSNLSSIFMFWFVSTETLVEEQSFVYPWHSLVFEVSKKTLHKVNPQVAEFGGTLGLFLGFSFMTLWDGLRHLSTALTMCKNTEHRYTIEEIALNLHSLIIIQHR